MLGAFGISNCLAGVIARDLAVAHGGRVEVESALGRGGRSLRIDVAAPP